MTLKQCFSIQQIQHLLMIYKSHPHGWLFRFWEILCFEKEGHNLVGAHLCGEFAIHNFNILNKFFVKFNFRNRSYGQHHINVELNGITGGIEQTNNGAGFIFRLLNSRKTDYYLRG